MIIVAVPELDALLADQPVPPPRLRAIFARARTRALDPSAWAAELVVGRALAAAPLTRRLDAPDDCQGCWLRADPVLLSPDLNAVWIRPGGQLTAGAPVIAELQAALGEAGLEFDLPHPERGYVRLDALPDCRFVPPGQVHGESLDYVLPSGPAARRWQRLINDCQVILHQHAGVNGPDAPGGLWFWGAGSLPSPNLVRPRIRQVAGIDPLWAALADWLNLPHDSRPQDRTPANDSLIEWRLNPAMDQSANLAALDDWLAPLWRSLRVGRLERLEIAGPRRAWTLGPAAAWRVWRRSAERPT